MPAPRRRFLARGLAAAGGLALGEPLSALARRLADSPPALGEAPWGPLEPALDETTGLPLLMLPRGFRCRSFGWTGDAMNGGVPTPPRHDGMACFAGGPPRLVLVRNHELDGGRPFGPAEITYDARTGGGTTTLEIDRRTGALLSSRASLTGTLRNCAGGPTPWGSWLSCEETLGFGAVPHGYVFEVPAAGPARPEPLHAMGRFVHEAVAVDPATGIVYETEDASRSGLYRFLPNVPGRLEEGGRLEMLAVRGAPNYDTRRGQPPGIELEVEWVGIDDPEGTRKSVFDQGAERGAAAFGRLEGAGYGAGEIWIVSTSGGDAGAGQVWVLDPLAGRLRLAFESNDPARFNGPDNLCVASTGDVVLCQDGWGPQHVFVLLRDGSVHPFARNNVVLNGERNGIRGDFRWSEFAGSTFSPGGRWLFVNVQEPGITFAITGEWTVALSGA